MNCHMESIRFFLSLPFALSQSFFFFLKGGKGFLAFLFSF